MEYEEANEKIIPIEIIRKKEKLRFRNRLKSMKRKKGQEKAMNGKCLNGEWWKIEKHGVDRIMEMGAELRFESDMSGLW